MQAPEGMAFWCSALFLGAALFCGTWAAVTEAENRALKRQITQITTPRTPAAQPQTTPTKGTKHGIR